MPLSAAAMALIGTGIGGGASIGNSILNRNASRYNTDKTIAANKELAEYAYAKDQEAWHRQNQYNSPQSQMARLKSAGLNPHLVYGTGTVTGNTSGTMPKYNAPKVDYNYEPVQLPAGQLGQFTDTMLRAAQVDNVRANTDNVKAKTITEAFNAGLMEKKVAAQELDNYTKDHYNTAIAPWISGKVQNEAIASNSLPKQKEAEAQRAQTLNELEKMRFKWEKKGLSPSDKLWLRIITKALPSMGIDPVKILGKELFNYLNSFK